MIIYEVKISEIKKNPNNPRTIKDEKFAKLVKSVKDFPEMLRLRPIVVNEDMIVLGGNMRLKACKEAGLKTVPIIKASDLTEDQQREFIIKDNVGFGEWDWEMLANEWENEKLEEWGVDLPDMDVKVLDAKEDDYEIPEEIKTDIVPGDLFEIGPHRLLCGDSTDADAVARLMNGEKADMVFTDPPYGVSYVQGKYTGNKPKKHFNKIKNDELQGDQLYGFIQVAFNNVINNTKDGCAYYVWTAALNEGYTIYRAVIDLGVHIQSQIIWDKNRLILGRADYHWQHEVCWYGYYGKNHYWCGDRKQTTIWKQNRDVNYNHPTQKPIELPERAISNSTVQNETVIDIFLGSGSTMVAAHQLGRKCYGMELDPKYCQVIVDRMRKLDPGIEIKRNGKLYK